uniref:Uncharacterized protein n=1 Tax=Arundo donax TaxID=35708 RepID=A0A0A9BMT0_ARUDO
MLPQLFRQEVRFVHSYTLISAFINSEFQDERIICCCCCDRVRSVLALRLCHHAHGLHCCDTSSKASPEESNLLNLASTLVTSSFHMYDECILVLVT